MQTDMIKNIEDLDHVLACDLQFQYAATFADTQAKRIFMDGDGRQAMLI